MRAGKRPLFGIVPDFRARFRPDFGGWNGARALPSGGGVWYNKRKSRRRGPGLRASGRPEQCIRLFPEGNSIQPLP